tara:strand:+ start:673 stop:939 length:267 start_codon:yes stop_codon:yes gene_type:complete
MIAESEGEMRVGEIVKLRHTKGAVNRTKNIIKTDGPDFTVLSEPRTVQFGPGMWILLESIMRNRSDGKGGKESWFGWLPIKEIETTDN